MRGRWTRVLAAGATALVAVAGCGGDGRGEALQAYVGEVNAAQRDLAIRTGSFNVTLRKFAAGEELGSLAPDLAELEAELSATQARVRRLEPPADARRLHALLVRHLQGQTELAREVTLFARYQPALPGVYEPLAAAQERLRRDLRNAADARAQAAAFGRFERALAAARARLDDLDPPQVLRSAHADQVDRLEALRRVNARLAATLPGDDRAAIDALLRQYASLIGEVDTAAQRRRRAAAVRTYNARIRELGRTAAAVRSELARLQRDL